MYLVGIFGCGQAGLKEQVFSAQSNFCLTDLSNTSKHGVTRGGIAGIPLNFLLWQAKDSILTGSLTGSLAYSMVQLHRADETHFQDAFPEALIMSSDSCATT